MSISKIKQQLLIIILGKDVRSFSNKLHRHLHVCTLAVCTSSIACIRAIFIRAFTYCMHEFQATALNSSIGYKLPIITESLFIYAIFLPKRREKSEGLTRGINKKSFLFIYCSLWRLEILAFIRIHENLFARKINCCRAHTFIRTLSSIVLTQ